MKKLATFVEIVNKNACQKQRRWQLVGYISSAKIFQKKEY